MAFSDLVATMDTAHAARLADSITYTPSGGSALTLDAYADFGERIVEFQTGSAEVPDAYVEVAVGDLAAKPASGDRIVMPDGNTYRPMSSPLNEDAKFYGIALKKVASA